MSSFPILPNESFTFNYDDKRGVELEFRPRKKEKRNKNEKPIQQQLLWKERKIIIIIFYSSTLVRFCGIDYLF